MPSHKGSSSHLPPYSSQPDPYPRPSLAQQACCLIPTKRFPAGGSGWGGGVGETKHSCTARPFDPVPWPAGADGSGRQQRVYSLPPPPLFYQPHRPQGLTERQEGAGETDREKGRVVGQNNNEETDMVCADHLLFFLHSSLDTDLSIPLFSPL